MFVEPHVRGADRRPAIRERGRLGGFDIVLQRLEPARRQLRIAVHQTADDVDLEHPAETVQVDHVPLAELGDEHAAMQLVDQQPLVGEQPERFAETCCG